MTTRGGWFEAPLLKDTLVAAGLPKTAPQPSSELQLGWVLLDRMARSSSSLVLCCVGAASAGSARAGDRDTLQPDASLHRIRRVPAPDPLDLHHLGDERVIGVYLARDRRRASRSTTAGLRRASRP